MVLDPNFNEDKSKNTTTTSGTNCKLGYLGEVEIFKVLIKLLL